MGVRVVLYVANDCDSLRSEVARGVEVKFAAPPIPASPLQALKLGWWAGRRMRSDGVTRCLLPSNSQFDGALPVIIATRNRVPVYAKISNPLWRPDRSWLGNAAFRILTRIRLAGVAGLAALSPRLLRHDDDAIGFTNRGHVQPDALGDHWPRTDAVARRPFHLCVVGRLVPQKNIALALSSVALVAGTFVIAGRSSCAVDDILPSPQLGTIVDDARPEAFARAIRAFFAGPHRHAHEARRELARSLFSSHLDAVSARGYLGFM